MPSDLEITDVPLAVRDPLVERATAEGFSLHDFLLAMLTRHMAVVRVGFES